MKVDKEQANEVLSFLNKALNISNNAFKLDSDEEINTEQDVYSLIQNLINEIEELL